MALTRDQLFVLARRGAEAKIAELREEIANIQREFPPSAVIAKDNTARNEAKPRRKKMSAAARKAASARMRKYWAERRKAGTAQ